MYVETGAGCFSNQMNCTNSDFRPRKKENGRKTSCCRRTGKLRPLGLSTLLGQMASMFINAFHVAQQQKHNQKEQEYPLILADGNVNGCSHHREQYGSSSKKKKKLNIELPNRPASRLLGMYIYGENYHSKRHMPPNVH